MKTLLIFLTLPFILSFTAAFAQGSSASEELRIVTPHWEGFRREFELGFNRYRAANKKKAVNFRWLDLGGTSDIHRYLKSKAKEGVSTFNIDVFFGGGIEPYLDLAELGAFLPVPIPASKDLPSHISGSPLRDVNGLWYAVTMNGFGILYNKNVINRLKQPVHTSPAE